MKHIVKSDLGIEREIFLIDSENIVELAENAKQKGLITQIDCENVKHLNELYIKIKMENAKQILKKYLMDCIVSCFNRIDKFKLKGNGGK